MPTFSSLRCRDEIRSKLGEDVFHFLIRIFVNSTLGDNGLQDIVVRTFHVRNELLLKGPDLGDRQLVQVATRARLPHKQSRLVWAV